MAALKKFFIKKKLAKKMKQNRPMPQWKRMMTGQTMFFTHPVLRDTALANGRSLYPKATVFSEILPFASKNRVIAKKTKAAASSCTQELQALFGCLKKWEFDDQPCGKQHTAYMHCVHEAERAAKEYKEAAKKGILGEGNSMTSTQFNKIMKLFPQPDLGQPPYRQMKRLPTQSYGDDIFHRKGSKGKAS